MKINKIQKIWTVGHSTRSFIELAHMLKSCQIEVVVDIRNYPGSRNNSEFNKEALLDSFPAHGFEYIHLKTLGGRRKPLADSKNSAWRHNAFRGFADYMETHDFQNGIQELCSIAETKKTVIMCSEAVWWRCHRSIISDYLKVQGWNVVHIMGINNEKEHPYTEPAKVFEGKLSYEKGDLLRS